MAQQLVVVTGSRSDGVRWYGEQLARVRAATGRPTLVCSVPNSSSECDDAIILNALSRQPVSESAQILLHVAPRLWRSDAPIRQAALNARHLGRPVVATLHELPEHTDGHERYERIAGACRDIRSVVDAVVVASSLEARLAAAIGVDAHVVFRPVFPGTRSNGHIEHDELRLAVLGRIHPGDGVLGLVDSLADRRGKLSSRTAVRVVGDSAPSDAWHLDDIIEAARRTQLPFTVSGEVSQHAWSEEIAATTVPVVPQRSVSASRTICDWIAHGRRPFARRSAFACELAERAPGYVHFVEDDDWISVVQQAVDDPTLTWSDTSPEALSASNAVDALDAVFDALPHPTCVDGMTDDEPIRRAEVGVSSTASHGVETSPGRRDTLTHQPGRREADPRPTW